ncbi:MAG TPA: FxDxF family PEP-CTERM protein [Phenylobacterium sp.]|nr:FxDxF family PEP-CTERM protein [Phenylobacterium sp.]
MAASLAILMLAAAPAANAAQMITLNPAEPDGSISGAFMDSGIAGGSFTDTFTFVFPQSGISAATISSILTTQMNNVSFTAVTLDGAAFTTDSTGAFESRHLPGMETLAGTQTLIVSGTSGGSGAFAGTLAFAPLAFVPEPASWSLMIIGFGGLGAVLRTRKRAQPATA